MIDTLQILGTDAFGGLHGLSCGTLIKIVCARSCRLMGCVAYLTLWERKAIAWTQVRPGPNRVGPMGLLTPIADAVKLIFKEIIRPSGSPAKGCSSSAPVMAIMPALWRHGWSCLLDRKWPCPTSTPACCS